LHTVYYVRETSLQEQIALLEDEIVARVGERTNRRLHPDVGYSHSIADDHSGCTVWHECVGVVPFKEDNDGALFIYL
jgi:hypothetical protein